MSQELMKKAAAESAISFVMPGSIVGVGTGSTTNHFIDLLGDIRQDVEGAVASSVATAKRLEHCGIAVLDLNNTGTLPIYVDGADEATKDKYLIKGGGGALTREKIIAAASSKFICIIDESKLVGYLGKFPLPIEVIPMARSYVARELVKIGGQPKLRQGVETDNGNIIIDIVNFEVLDPVSVERQINQIPGVVTVGLFAQRSADILLIGKDDGVDKII